MPQCILIADDDPVIRRLVSFSLIASDFDVVEAADGDAALIAIRRNRVAVAILDIQMPGNDDMAVLKRLKGAEATKDLPVMILTGDRDTKMVQAALRAGAADYLVKPFDPDVLADRVARLAAGKLPEPRLRKARG
jgi:DNA-binding response OmpR family regulator